MAPSRWEDEEDDSTPPSSPPAPVVRRRQFDDEEDESDVVESWDAADDSEAEREKARQAAEVKAKAEAEAKANHKSKAQRIEERRVANMQAKLEAEDYSDESEDEADRRARLRQSEKDADLKNAEDMFGEVGIHTKRSAKPVTLANPNNPTQAIDLSALTIFAPQTRDQFVELRETLVPLISNNSKKAHYTTFMTEFAKQITKDLPSDQIKKIASALTALSNEKMKEEKAAEKGGKKTKAAKTKTTLNAARDVALRADTNAYDDDGLGDDDFM